MLYTASSSPTGLFTQMWVTDYTAEGKFSMSSCTDLGSDWVNCGNLLNGGDEFRNTAKWPVSRSHHTGTGEGANQWGVRGTCCNKLHQRLHYGDTRLAKGRTVLVPGHWDRTHLVNVPMCQRLRAVRAPPGFCLLPKQGMWRGLGIGTS